ncbi:MAG: MmcQ/YjbR family DNA-binding protein [Cellulosilyticaceae bacterium]
MKYQWLYEYLLDKPGVVQDYKEEWKWTRYLIGGKMYAAICKNATDEDCIVTLKLEPFQGELFRKTYKDITPGYYMNKTHWNSVDLEGDLPCEVLKEMADTSYALVLKGLPKKIQKEILEDTMK